MTESPPSPKEPEFYWCCLRCAMWTQVDQQQLCADCVSTIKELVGRSHSLRANLVMFDGEEP